MVERANNFFWKNEWQSPLYFVQRFYLLPSDGSIQLPFWGYTLFVFIVFKDLYLSKKEVDPQTSTILNISYKIDTTNDAATKILSFDGWPREPHKYGQNYSDQRTQRRRGKNDHKETCLFICTSSNQRLFYSSKTHYKGKHPKK